jgi:hypothetical protein
MVKKKVESQSINEKNNAAPRGNELKRSLKYSALFEGMKTNFVLRSEST